MFFLASIAFSKLLYISLYTNNTNYCNLSYPCNADYIKNMINYNDKIFFIDYYAYEPDKLEDLRNIINYALKMDCSILSEKFVVNGSLYNNSDFSFIYNNGANKCNISGFEFIEFTKTIIYIREANEVYIKNCNFFHNNNKGEMGLIIFTFSNCVMKNCKIEENRYCNTSIISAFSSELYFKSSTISNNLIVNNSFTGIIISINSNIDFEETVLSNNISPMSSIFQPEWNSFINISNSTIQNNTISNIVECEGVCNITISNSKVNNNNGGMYKSITDKTRLYIESSEISFNKCDSLFNIQNGKLFTIKSSTINSNIGLTFLQSYENQSKSFNLFVSQSNFSNNKLQNSIFNDIEESKITIESSSFNNNTLNQIMNAKDSIIRVTKTNFINIIGDGILCNNCTSIISSSTFNNLTGLPLNLSSSFISFSFIFGSYFSKSILNPNYFIIDGDSYLLMNIFNSHKPKSNNQTNSYCFFCKYNEKNPTVYTISDLILSLFQYLLLLLFPIVLIIIKQRYHCVAT